LLEDIGHGGDLTTDAIVPPNLRATARVVAHDSGVAAGIETACLAFGLLDPSSTIEMRVADGERVEPGQTLVQVAGIARALLTGERAALNVMTHLSGIATATRKLVDMLLPFRAQICCTRKTLPGLRILEKYAVRCGGGKNHRFGLDDGVLIKDNHLVLAGSIADTVRAVREGVGHMVKIEIEVDTLEQLREALDTPIDAVLLDNMTIDQLTRAVQMVDGRLLTEASGNITGERIVEVARTGVDLISCGRLTHSSVALDLGLDVEFTPPTA
jgi:nicotinate-nucleotide pyrophosphorylase (carboxylating)